MVESWYRHHYYEMSDAGRWFGGNGFNLLTPDTWESRPYRVLIVRLSTVRDTAESFTHRLLYRIAAGCEGVFADCAWLPPPEDGALFDRSGIAWMTGVVTKRPALDFDCIALSNSIVQEIITIPVMLQKSGIPAGKTDRMGRPEIPLVLLGGANAQFTSVLYGDDPPVDAIFIGEDIGSIAALFTAGRTAKAAGEDKRMLLQRWRDLPGIVEPDTSIGTVKFCGDLNGTAPPADLPVFAGEGNCGAGTLQISEGCPCFCTFCAESWSRKPYREADPATCIGTAVAMKAAMGLDRIDLYSFNFTMHSGLRELLWELAEYFPAIGLKSQRLDGIADDPELLKIEHAVGKSSMTAGIEGISGRMRSRLQKGLDDIRLFAGIKLLIAAPIRELKLFFLATGAEDEHDFNGFRELMHFISETIRSVRRQPRIIVSMTPLVRFPFTPLEREDAPDPAIVKNIILQCERIVQAKRFEFRSAASMNEYLFSQIVVRAADRRIFPALSRAVEQSGFVYYNDISDRFITAFRSELQNAGCCESDLLAGMKEGDRLPVSTGVNDSFLDNIRRSAAAAVDPGYCLGSVLREGECRGCGCCEDDTLKHRMTGRRVLSPVNAEKIGARLRRNAPVIAVFLRCVIDSSLRGISRRFTAACVAKLFMRHDPVLTRRYRGFGGSAVEKRFATEWIHGDDVITLHFAGHGAETLEKVCNDEPFRKQMNEQLSGTCTVTSVGLTEPETQTLTFRITAPWRGDPASYLSKYALKYTLVRSGEGWTEYQLTKDALKKQVLLSIRSVADADRMMVELAAGGKFNYTEFIRTVFSSRTPEELVRIAAEVSIG